MHGAQTQQPVIMALCSSAPVTLATGRKSTRGRRSRWQTVAQCAQARQESPRSAVAAECLASIDARLSQRPLDLDPFGYFLIKVDHDAQEIVAQHFGNTINEQGLACDPDTGKVIPCDGSYRTPPMTKEYRGRTAKELSALIVEGLWLAREGDGAGGSKSDFHRQTDFRPSLSMLNHANYLGREFQKAEECLKYSRTYVQD